MQKFSFTEWLVVSPVCLGWFLTVVTLEQARRWAAGHNLTFQKSVFEGHGVLHVESLYLSSYALNNGIPLYKKERGRCVHLCSLCCLHFMSLFLVFTLQSRYLTSLWFSVKNMKRSDYLGKKNKTQTAIIKPKQQNQEILKKASSKEMSRISVSR